MKAAVSRLYGPPQTIALEDIETPVPGPDEILVRVHAASVNDFDVGLLRGEPRFIRLFSGLTRPKIQVTGCDIAGEVTAVGSAITRWQAGDRVYGDLSGVRFGGFAEYACIKENQVAAMAPEMSYIDAAGIPQAAVLAWQGLNSNGPLRDGMKILFNGAGGGVGTYGVQLAKVHDVEVTGVDSAEKLDVMREAGFDHVLDYRSEDFTRQGKRYDLIVDAKSNRNPFAYLRALNPGGGYATVGGYAASYFTIGLLGGLLRLLSGKRLRLLGLQANLDLDYFSRLYGEGKLKTFVDGPFPFSRIVDALQYYETARHKGKIIIDFDQSTT